MFEEESKEYANKWLEHVKNLELQHKTDDKPEYIRILEAHQKGAEFGYNKCLEEAKQNYNVSDINFAIIADYDKRIAELTKANEWQYPSKGELPKENKRYLCKIKAFVGSGIRYECFDYDTEYNSWKDVSGDVIAWKEIELPQIKEIKE